MMARQTKTKKEILIASQVNTLFRHEIEIDPIEYWSDTDEQNEHPRFLFEDFSMYVMINEFVLVFQSQWRILMLLFVVNMSDELTFENDYSLVEMNY